MSFNDFIYEYSDDGRLIKTDVVLRMYTTTKDGSLDPTSMREYGILCQNIVNGKPCHSKIFGENEDQTFVTCNVCGAILGYIQVNDGEMQ